MHLNMFHEKPSWIKWNRTCPYIVNSTQHVVKQGQTKITLCHIHVFAATSWVGCKYRSPARKQEREMSTHQDNKNVSDFCFDLKNKTKKTQQNPEKGCNHWVMVVSTLECGSKNHGFLGNFSAITGSCPELGVCGPNGSWDHTAELHLLQWWL